MNPRTLVWSLSTILVAAIVSVGATFITGKSPLLGLDLKGGVEVVLQPQTKHINSTTLTEAVTIINNRVNGYGISNASVTKQGSNIVIELPGAKNDTQVLKELGQTAQLFFRPVVCMIAPYVAPTPATTAPSKTPTATTTTTPSTANKAKANKAKGSAKSTSTTSSGKKSLGVPVVAKLDSAVRYIAAGGASTTTASTTTASTTTASTTATSAAKPATTTTTSAGTGKPGTTTTTAKASTTTTTVPSTTTTTSLGQGICSLSSTQQQSYIPPHGDSHGLTPPSWDNEGSTVVLPHYTDYSKGKYTPDYRYVLGPAEMTGSIVSRATATINTSNDQWQVDLTFTGKGSKAFNQHASAHYACYVQNESNPPYCAQQAIELDGVVESAPVIEASNYNGAATINGSTSNPFTSAEAQSLADALNYGSLPVRLVAQTIDDVSPTVGTQSLRAGAIAGAVAVLLVILYLVFYYRALGLVVVLGICMSGALLYAITTLLSATSELALTLSGVIGLIVSVGVTADSCVIYFERLKEEIRSGRTVRTSVERSFNRAFRTILAADFSSFIAALILYALTVGDVRGFAFFLGLATLLNIVTTYLFTRPLVILLGRRSVGEGGILGVGRGLGAGPALGAGGLGVGGGSS